MGCDKFGGTLYKNSGCVVCGGCAEEIRGLFNQVTKLTEALEFYAKSEHYYGEWDTVSGEPQNLLCLEECDIGHWIESGEVARTALKECFGD